MGRIIQVPDEGFVREALIAAECRLYDKTGRRFSLMLDRADEAGLALSVSRDDGALGEFTASVPRHLFFTKEPREYVNAWILKNIDRFVREITANTVDEEPVPQAETEQRYAVAIVFGGRPDIVLTPERGVPADEAVRVYSAFVAGAAAIGGRPAMLPLGA